SELATLESELKELERSIKAIGDIPRTPSGGPRVASYGEPPPRTPPRSSIDDELARL
ncbi:MAG: hypothetical protein HOV81_13105, partial [Kofleriaceae bacterium]|nr:hypothetical protein [Kofleriaceae bacterium]